MSDNNGVRKPHLILPVAIWLAVIVASIGAAVLLTGCATKEEEVWVRVCYEQYMGKDERGLLVIRHFCVKAEAVE